MILDASRIILFAVLLFTTNCIGKPLITLNLLNRSGYSCPEVSIELSGRVEELAGNVPNGDASFTSDYLPNPMPSTAILRWATESKSNYLMTLLIPKSSIKHAEFLDYYFVILPQGRANVIVIAWSGEPTEAKVEHDIVLENKLCCDGGPNYRVAVKDTTDFIVDGLDVRFGNYDVNAGTHLSNTGQNYSIATGLPYPVTKSVSLHWMTSDGHSWDKIVDLTNILPSDLNDKCFWFILKEQGNVEVKIVDWKDLRAGKYPNLCHGF